MTTAGRRCLIVDDEALVAMLLADYLEALDWTVVASVSTAEEALAVLASDGIDLAILDCNLGGNRRSWVVADTLAKQDTPFLFSSGLNRDQLPSRFAARTMLAKPYSLASLQAAINAATAPAD